MKATAFKNKLYGRSSDRRVEQIGNVLTNADYEILLSGTSDDNYYIGETRKTASLTYNPSTNQLKINGTAVLTQHQDISGKVNKSGDTMSGNLTLTASQYIIKNNLVDLTKSDNDVSVNQYRYFAFHDSNDYYSGFCGNDVCTDGSVVTSLYARNYQTGTTTYSSHGVRLTIAKDGTRTVSVSDKTAWRTGLGVDSAISNITRSGTTFTATRVNGTTFTFTQQDNNTTYSFTTKTITGSATTFSAGEVKGITIDITNSGYTALAIRGVQLGNVYFMINEFYLSSATRGYLQLWNRASSSQTVTPKLMVEYYKQN